MKKIIFNLLLLCPLLALNMPLIAQRAVVSRGNYVRSISSQGNNTWFDRYDKKSIDQIGLAFGISTMGVGLEAVTSINYKVDLRLGITYMPPAIGLNKSLDVKDQVLKDRVVGNYNPEYRVSFKPNLFHGHVMFDYYPSENKTLHLTAGLFVGKSELQARGYLVNPSTNKPAQLASNAPDRGWPNLIADGRSLSVKNGRLEADIRYGAIVKPYIGIGFGRAIPGNSGLTVNCDLGVVVQPSHSIYQDGNKIEEVNQQDVKDAIDISSYKGFGVWPMVRLQFAFRAR